MSKFISLLINAILYVCLAFLGYICVHSVVSTLAYLLSSCSFTDCFQSTLAILSLFLSILAYGISDMQDKNSKPKYL